VVLDAPDDASASEARLVRRAQAGDADAYGDLVALHQAAAFRVGWVLLGSATDAEDAAQEAFVKAYLALDRFRAGEPFRPWLLQIVGNEARNRRRARGRHEGLLQRAIASVRGGSPGVPAPTTDVALEPSPEALAIAGESRAEVRAALLRLREEERQVVHCRYLLELSEAETAAALGIPSGTVKSRLHRALGRLRTELEPADQPAGATR
jgi:RNA polymerase sigma factor (sigma-70 family)